MKNKIFVIEDNIQNNNLMKTALEMQGFQVTQAFDGKQGMFYLQNNSFQLAIVDLQLPHVHGTEIIDLTLSKPVHPEIIVYSSSIDKHPELKTKPLFAVCQKPMSILKFVDICKEAINKSSTRESTPETL